MARRPWYVRQAAREATPSCALTGARTWTGAVPLVVPAADRRAGASLPSGRSMARRATGAGALGSEHRGVSRHTILDAGRRPAYARLDIVCEAILPIGGMEAGQGQQRLAHVVRQLAAAQRLV